MPADFDKAVKSGGRVRTVEGPNKQFGLKNDEYVHVVFKDGKMHKGYTKKKNPAVKEMEKRGY